MSSVKTMLLASSSHYVMIATIFLPISLPLIYILFIISCLKVFGDWGHHCG